MEKGSRRRERTDEDIVEGDVAVEDPSCVYKLIGLYDVSFLFFSEWAAEKSLAEGAERLQVICDRESVFREPHAE